MRYIGTSFLNNYTRGLVVKELTVKRFGPCSGGQIESDKIYDKELRKLESNALKPVLVPNWI